MKLLPSFAAAVALFAGSVAFAQDETDTPPANDNPPANNTETPANNNTTPSSVNANSVVQPPPPERKKIAPDKQIDNLYNSFKEGKGYQGLRDLLSSNPNLTEAGMNQIARAIQVPLNTVGNFVDYQVVKEDKPSERVQVVKVIAHHENQPFMNEFTFYDNGDGFWRLINLRYDANLVTMFEDE
ncbi:MAG: hypothetical protein AAF585_00740 [Verrucomicrobiota bacterium]